MLIMLVEQPILGGKKYEKTVCIIAVEDKININTALKEELMLLSGIGEKKAANIIKYRDKNGDFKDKNELKNVDGISSKLYNDIVGFITIN